MMLPRSTLPDFLIIGAQKCGTTSLYERLVEHPGVVAASRKEVHFFDLEHHRGAAWYARHFDANRGRRITGEATPYYLFHPRAAARAAALLPECRLIVLLRDPAARALSHYHQEVRHGVEPLPLSEALAAEEARLSGEHERLRSDPNHRSPAHQHYSYKARGRYAEQLDVWLARYPRDQLLVVDADQLARDPAPTLARVFAFLGLPPDGGARPLRRLNAGGYPPPPREVRESLARYFEPHDRRLERLIGWAPGRQPREGAA